MASGPSYPWDPNSYRTAPVATTGALNALGVGAIVAFVLTPLTMALIWAWLSSILAHDLTEDGLPLVIALCGTVLLSPIDCLVGGLAAILPGAIASILVAKAKAEPQTSGPALLLALPVTLIIGAVVGACTACVVPIFITVTTSGIPLDVLLGR